MRIEVEEAATALADAGEIPLDAAIRRHADDGRPVVLAEPDSPSGAAFAAITGRLAQQVSIQAFKHIALTIVEE